MAENYALAVAPAPFWPDAEQSARANAWARVGHIVATESEETLLAIVMQLGGGGLNPQSVRQNIRRRRTLLPRV